MKSILIQNFNMHEVLTESPSFEKCAYGMTLGQTWRRTILFFYERREGGGGCSDLICFYH